MPLPVKFVSFILAAHLEMLNHELRFNIDWMRINIVRSPEGTFRGNAVDSWACLWHLVVHRLGGPDVLADMVDGRKAILVGCASFLVDAWHVYWLSGDIALSHSSNTVEIWFEERGLESCYFLGGSFFDGYVGLIVEPESGEVRLFVFVRSSIAKTNPLADSLIQLQCWQVGKGQGSHHLGIRIYLLGRHLKFGRRYLAAFGRLIGQRCISLLNVIFPLKAAKLDGRRSIGSLVGSVKSYLGWSDGFVGCYWTYLN